MFDFKMKSFLMCFTSAFNNFHILLHENQNDFFVRIFYSFYVSSSKRDCCLFKTLFNKITQMRK